VPTIWTQKNAQCIKVVHFMPFFFTLLHCFYLKTEKSVKINLHFLIVIMLCVNFLLHLELFYFFSKVFFTI